MVERAPILDTICHAILIAGALLVCVPLYFAFVAGSLSIAEVQKVPLPWLPGDQFFANLQTAWIKADFSRTFLNSLWWRSVSPWGKSRCRCCRPSPSPISASVTGCWRSG